LAAILVGFGYAISAPAGSIILAANTPKKFWGTLFSLRMAGVPAGGAFAGLAVAAIVVQYDWRISLVALVLPSCLSLIFLRSIADEIYVPKPSVKFSILSIFNPKIIFNPVSGSKAYTKSGNNHVRQYWLCSCSGFAIHIFHNLFDGCTWL
jgi:MFS family permease